MKHLFNYVKLGLALLTLFLSGLVAPSAFAEDVYSGPMIGFMMSPMTKSVSLNPGDSYSDSFWLMNPEQNTASVEYMLTVQSFYRDNNGDAVFEDVDGKGEMAKWITLNTPDSGELAPGTSVEIKYTINVPAGVHGGGQYASIRAASVPPSSAVPDSASLQESVAMAYTIFAEISGETIKSGQIKDLSVPSFLSSGNITASSMVANTGNIHESATYIMEVYPLFSSQPAYSNATEPDKKLVLPDRSVVYETTWEETPMVGIFNVKYRVDFAGNSEEIERLVIKCPIWLILVIIIVIIGVIILLIYKRRQSSAPVPPEEVAE